MTVLAVAVVSLSAGMPALRFFEELRKRKLSYDIVMNQILSDSKSKEESLLESSRERLYLSESEVSTFKMKLLAWMNEGQEGSKN